MGILINKESKVLVQGMTGREGKRATEEMLSYGTNVVCGVTPGKGGHEILGLKIYDSVQEAVKVDPTINTSVIYVPPLMVYDAGVEAINAGMKVVVVVTENVPIKDTASLLYHAKNFDVRLVGPSSVGIITVGEAKVGSIGGRDQGKVYTKGTIGVMSKSGGMCSETALLLSQEGLGQSTVVGIGGDTISGSDFVDIALLFEKDEDTKCIVMFGEIGGQYEALVADLVRDGKLTKPVVAYINGTFAEYIPKKLALGHVGAIIERGEDTADYKKQRLREAGILVADFHDEIPDLVKQALEDL